MPNAYPDEAHERAAREQARQLMTRIQQVADELGSLLNQAMRLDDLDGVKESELSLALQRARLELQSLRGIS